MKSREISRSKIGPFSLACTDPYIGIGWEYQYNLSAREGIKSGTNVRKPEPKSGTKFCQPNMGTKHACIKLKFMSNVDYRLVFEMHITIGFHFFNIFFSKSIEYATMSSKKISNDQELIQSDPISCPQNQKGNN